MAGKSFGDFVRRWEMFNNALKPKLPDLPHLAQDQADFESLITEVKALDDQQKKLRGSLQDMTQQRRATYLKGLDLHDRLASQLKGTLGPRNQTLVGFGLKPKKTPKSRKTETPGTPQPTPPPAPHPAASAVPHEAQEATPAPPASASK